MIIKVAINSLYLNLFYKNCNNFIFYLTNNQKPLNVKKEDNFTQLVKENSERIMRICCYYGNGGISADDLYQEVLINIWKSLSKFRGESSVYTWIYRVAVNTCLTHAVKSNKYYSTKVTPSPSLLNNLADSELLDKIEEEERYEKLSEEINLLSVIDKALISLVIEGLSTREISEVIGITEPNVRTKISRIKTELRLKFKIEKNEDN